MSGSMSHWAPSSFSGRASAPGVEDLDSQQKKNSTDCKGCGRFNTTTTAGLTTQLRCIRNRCSTTRFGGSNKKRKTKMQKKKKNRRTLRKMSKKKIGGKYPHTLADIDGILDKDPDCNTFEVYRTNGTRVTTRSRFDLTRAEDKATFRANIIDNHYGLTPFCE